MKILFLFDSVIYLFISFFLAFSFFKHYNKPYINRATNWFSLSIFGYIALMIISFLWFLGILAYSAGDFLFIYSSALILETLVFFKLTYLFTKRKILIYLLGLYIISLISLLFFFSHYSFLSLVISFFIIFILSLNFISAPKECKRLGYLTLIYSCFSFLFILASFLWLNNYSFFSIISNLLFLTFVIFFLKDISYFPFKVEDRQVIKKRNYSLLFVKYFIFIIVLTSLVLISTVGIHEFGHVIASRLYGCESKVIVYEFGEYPYTEILCPDNSGKFASTLAGPAIVVVIAIFLFIFGGRIIREISLL